MPIQRRQVPVLPERPAALSVVRKAQRSYPVGRHLYSRAFAGKVLELTISAGDYFPPQVQARLVTTFNARQPGDPIEFPFTRSDERTFTCRITPERTGFYTFRAQFSTDGGATWFPDPVPDAWVLVDPPQVDELRLYTLIPTVSGTIADWANDLPRIKEMGFNTIHLLPLTTLDASMSPYAARDLFDIDHGYLMSGVRSDGLSQLEDFVETARSLEMRLCFDLVLNHVGLTSTMARRAPGWIVPDPNSPDGLKRAGYWCERGWLFWEDLVLVNYEHPSVRMRMEIWAYMTEYALFWAKYANYTNGFIRFDNLHSSDTSFLHSLTRTLHDEYPKLGAIAEYFTDDDTLLDTVPQWGLNLVLATPWNHRFVPQLREYLKSMHRVSEHVRYFMPITSHDSGSPAQEFGSNESIFPRYVAAAMLGTGATGITQGVEWGQAEKIEFIGRRPKLPRPPESRFAPFIKTVNRVLSDHAAFHCGGNCHFVDNGHHAVIAAYRKDKAATGGYLVICNFDIMGQQYIEIDLSSLLETSGLSAFRDLLTGKDFSFPGTRVNFLLSPSEALVLMTQTPPSV
jgi:starch synthase (maltosyl-transferring)